jgi:hypothetical protein
MTAPGIVTNHAVLRYQQRVAPLSQEAVREVLGAPEVQSAISAGHQYFTLPTGHRAVFKAGRVATVLPLPVEIDPCPFCGTQMLRHKACFSHPHPSEGDCILRHYSFDMQKVADWNRRDSRSKPEGARPGTGLDAKHASGGARSAIAPNPPRSSRTPSP